MRSEEVPQFKKSKKTKTVRESSGELRINRSFEM